MQLKKEISIGNIVSICSSVIMIVYMWASLHFQVDNHEKRITALEASTVHLNDTMIELATTVKDHESQTINIK